MRITTPLLLTLLVTTSACAPPEPPVEFPQDDTPIATAEVLVYERHFEDDASELIHYDLDAEVANIVDLRAPGRLIFNDMRRVGDGPYVIYNWDESERVTIDLGQIGLVISTLNKSINTAWTIPFATDLKFLGVPHSNQFQHRASEPAIAPAGNAVAYYEYSKDVDGATLSSLNLIDMSTGESTLLDTAKLGTLDKYDISWAPDGSKFTYIGSPDPVTTSIRRFYTLPSYTNTESNAGSGPFYASAGQRWIDSRYYLGFPSGQVSILDTQTGDTQFYAFPVAGTRYLITRGDNGRFMIHSNDAGLYLGYTNQAPVAFDAVGAPQWSPDGEMLAFASDRDADGIAELYISDADGNAPRLISGPHAGAEPKNIIWAPDSSGLLFQAGFYGLYYVGAADSLSTEFAASSVRVDTVSWSPDSSVFAYKYFDSFDSQSSKFTASLFVAAPAVSPTPIMTNIENRDGNFPITQVAWSKTRPMLAVRGYGDGVDFSGMAYERPLALVNYSVYPYQSELLAAPANEPVWVKTHTE